MAFSHLATTSVATQLPTMLVKTNIAERMRWMPSTSAMLLTGMVLVADSVSANTAIADPGNPGAALGREQQHQQQTQLRLPAQVGAGGLPEEHADRREVQARAVVIEAVGGR